MMRIPTTKSKHSEKGQSTIGLLIFFPVLLMMVMALVYTGQPIYLKLAAQNAAYSYAVVNARSPIYNIAAMDAVGEYVVNRTPGMTTMAKQTILINGDVDRGAASDDPNQEFMWRGSEYSQVTIVPAGDKNDVWNYYSWQPEGQNLWSQLMKGIAFGPRATFMRCDVDRCWYTQSDGDKGWTLIN